MEIDTSRDGVVKLVREEHAAGGGSIGIEEAMALVRYLEAAEIEEEGSSRTVIRQGEILRGLAAELKGPPDENVWHDVSGLADVARSLRLENAVLREQNERFAKEAREHEVGEVTRSAEWRRAIRSAVIDFESHEDESDDVNVLRDCLIRTRLAAAAERQCAATKSIVADILPTEMRDGKKIWRFCVSVPTGDLGELSEVARLYLAAWSLSLRDAERADHATWKRMSDAVIEAVAALDEDDTRFADESRVSMALAELTKLAREFGPQSHTPEADRPTDPEGP